MNRSVSEDLSTALENGTSSRELLNLFRQKVQSKSATLSDRLNLRVLEADMGLLDTNIPKSGPTNGAIRVAIVSLLFNWPSTGGGIVHTAELAKFLSLAGYQVCHFYAVHEPWRIGAVSELLPYPSEAMPFTQHDWNAATIKSRFKNAVDKFSPDCVIVTDSWNSKLLLAEAVAEYPYCLRLAAMECLCPLNNVRLLCEDKDNPRQCNLTQLGARDSCVRCVNANQKSSGGLHASERQLVGFDEPAYGTRLIEAFRKAYSVLVVNHQIAALVESFANDVKVIPSGFDIHRFDDLPKRERGDGPFRILFASLIDEYMKGFHVLLSACRRLWEVRQDFELWITADDCRATDPFIKSSGWQSQAELPHTMALCDVVAVPTVAQEALGRTAVEAMGASRAVIASSLGGLREVVCHGLTGLLVKTADPEELAKGLIVLMDNPELTSQFGKNGRIRFDATYPWSTIIDRHYKPLFEGCRRRK